MFVKSNSNTKIVFVLIFLLGAMSFAQPKLTLISPKGGEFWAVGSRPNIIWESKNIPIVKIELSIDDGATWETIVPFTIANTGLYNKWKVTEPYVSNNCRIRISKYDSLEFFVESETTFNIVDSLATEKIVVLGSSTAAGTGPSSPDSAWVNRYRKYMQSKNTSIKVINLAVGGYTTYQLMPDGYTQPAGKPSPDKGHNITKAISYNPKAIIINLPSNDAAHGYGVEEQISNYDTMLAITNEENIPVWVATTQPRNFDENKIQIQMEMRDSTYTHFGNYAIDFWSDIALENGRINPLYNSGDGVHLNNAGHRILYKRVIAAGIYEQTILPTSVEENTVKVPTKFELAQNYPNPFNPTTTIKYTIPYHLLADATKGGQSNVARSFSSNVLLNVYNVLGQKIATLVNERKSTGTYEVSFNAGSLSSGTYIYVLSTDGFVQAKKMLLLK